MVIKSAPYKPYFHS